MKKLSLLCIIALTLMFLSCSKDDDTKDQQSTNTTTSDSVSILGEWNLTELSYTGTNEITQLGQTIKTEFSGKGGNYNCKVYFEDNPKLVTSDGDYDINLSITVEGLGNNTIKQTNINFKTVGEWTQEDNLITVKNNEYNTNDTAEIKELTASKMVLEGKAKRDLQNNGQIVDIDYKYVLTR